MFQAVPYHGGTASGDLSLAYAELYLTLATLFASGQFDLELFETDATDVEMRHDFIML